MVTAPKSMKPKREIAIVLYEGVMPLEATGPAAVLFSANQRDACVDYRVAFVSARGGLVRGEGGLLLQSEQIGSADRIHTLIVAGTRNVESLLADAETLDLIRNASRRARRVVSICTGAFALAACGMLDGRRAATHWQYVDSLAQRFPKVRVDAESLFLRDGAYWTSAGATAGLDLALALVEEDCGKTLAMTVARDLVFYIRRPGSESQFSMPLRVQSAERAALDRLRHVILERPNRAWTVQQLAEKARISTRQLLRLFRQEFDMSPREFIQSVVLEHARYLLHGSDCHIGEVARQCGFGSSTAFSRCFKAYEGVTPSMYRARHRAGQEPAAAFR